MKTMIHEATPELLGCLSANIVENEAFRVSMGGAAIVPAFEQELKKWQTWPGRLIFCSEASPEGQKAVGVVALNNIHDPTQSAEVHVGFWKPTAAIFDLSGQILDFMKWGMGINRLWARVADDNRTARRFVESIGFKETGRIPQHFARPKGLNDAIIYFMELER